MTAALTLSLASAPALPQSASVVPGAVARGPGAPSWAECHAAGMTVRQAAQARAATPSAARNWAARHHRKWASGAYWLTRQPEAIALAKQGVHLSEAARRMKVDRGWLSRMPLPDGMAWGRVPRRPATSARLQAWLNLAAQGLSASQAAAAMGLTVKAAWTAASRGGFRFATATALAVIPEEAAAPVPPVRRLTATPPRALLARIEAERRAAEEATATRARGPRFSDADRAFAAAVLRARAGAPT